MLNRLSKLIVLAVVGVFVLAGCSGGSGGSDDGAEGASGSASASASDSASADEAATPPPKPKVGACHRLGYKDALAPTSEDSPVPCKKGHTTETYAVGQLDTVVDGHQVAIDSDHVQGQPARKCTPQLRSFLGGDLDDLRLSMLRAVWFTPTVAESDSGAAWFRCDVIAVAGSERLGPLKGSLKGALGSDRAEDYAMCDVAEPGTPKSQRVMCRAKHSWKAIDVVPLPAGDYPGLKEITGTVEDACLDAARDAAADPLQFDWGSEPPTKEQWQAGQTYGICWAPA